MELEDAKKAAAFKKALEGRLELEVWRGAEAKADALQACRVAWIGVGGGGESGGGGAEAIKASAWQGRQRSGV